MFIIVMIIYIICIIISCYYYYKGWLVWHLGGVEAPPGPVRAGLGLHAPPRRQLAEVLAVRKVRHAHAVAVRLAALRALLQAKRRSFIQQKGDG